MACATPVRLRQSTAMPVRIYLTGRLDVECDGLLADTRLVPGRQGRCALAYLICERTRPVPREELAGAIWHEAIPNAWDTAVRVLVSKLRAFRGSLGLAGAEVISGASGCYQLRLPPDAWIDL